MCSLLLCCEPAAGHATADLFSLACFLRQISVPLLYLTPLRLLANYSSIYSCVLICCVCTLGVVRPNLQARTRVAGCLLGLPLYHSDSAATPTRTLSSDSSPAAASGSIPAILPPVACPLTVFFAEVTAAICYSIRMLQQTRVGRWQPTVPTTKSGTVLSTADELAQMDGSCCVSQPGPKTSNHTTTRSAHHFHKRTYNSSICLALTTRLSVSHYNNATHIPILISPPTAHTVSGLPHLSVNGIMVSRAG